MHVTNFRHLMRGEGEGRGGGWANRPFIVIDHEY